MKLLKNDKKQNEFVEEFIKTRLQNLNDWEFEDRVELFHRVRGGFHEEFVTLDYAREFGDRLSAWWWNKFFTELFFIYRTTTDEEELIYVKRLIREFTDEFYSKKLDEEGEFTIYVPRGEGEVKRLVLSPWNYDRLLKRKIN